ncbi:ATP-binding protein [Streptomyces sp. NPDC057430]|uniref:ATP-binding protein n=1 Tax=Streptomyces sp. NPDC057430 TaxID=3346131 RepID=UPI0036946803
MATVSPPASWSYALHLPHNHHAPRVARMTLRAALAGHGMTDRVDAAELLTSELVTNAYRHSHGPSALRLRHTEGDRLRISVWDTNPHIPAPFNRRHLTLTPPPDVATGRGLFLVQHYADNWGGYPLGDDLFGRGGKLLWCELAPPPHLTERVGPADT